MNLLNEAPMHPYEMKLKMRERGHERAVRIKDSSIYDTVERLAGLGFIEPVETSREGRRPERTVYRLTEAGSDELQSWMRELISVPSPEFPEFAAALMFIVGVRDKNEVVELLRHRAMLREGELAVGEAYSKAAIEQINLPRIFDIESEFIRYQIRGEIAWIHKTITELEDGTLEWPPFADGKWGDAM